MTDYVPETEVAAYLDQKFGKGKWRFTSEYRSPAKEDALRAEGAGTVPKGELSSHSRGRPGAAGAVDLQVDGLSADEVAHAMRDGPFTKAFAEGRHGPEGAHVHAETIPALPSGFKLDSAPVVGDGGPPPLPAGFKLDDASDASPKEPPAAPRKPTPLQRAAAEAGHVAGGVGRSFGHVGMEAYREHRDAVRNLASDLTPPPGPIIPRSFGEGVDRMAEGGRRFLRLPGEIIGAGGGGAIGGVLTAGVGEPVVNTLKAALGRDPMSTLTGGRYELDPAQIGNIAGMLIPGLGEANAERALAARAGRAGVGAETLRTAEGVRVPGNALRAATERPGGVTQHDNDVRLLHDNGVRMTSDQIKGGAAKEAESKAGSDANFGFARRQQVRQSIADFDRAIYGRSLELIGEKYPKDGPVGMDAVDHLFNVADQKYEAVKPKINLQPTPELETDFQMALHGIGPAGSAERADLQHIIDTRIKSVFDAKGRMDGQQFKDLESYLAEQSRALHQGNAYQMREGEAIDSVLASLRENMEQHSDPSVRTELRNLNAYYASINRIADAAYQAKASEGVFTPAQALTAAGKGGAKARRMVARGRAFNQDLIQAAQRVLPDKYPDSGTAGRLKRGIGAQIGGSIGASAGAAMGLHGGIPGALEGGGVGGALGALGGAAVDRAVAPTTNALARAMLERSAQRQLARHGLTQPTNYLRNIDRRAISVAAPIAAITNQSGQQ